MGGNVSRKDMEIISNGILDGLGTVDQLPSGVKGALFDYWDSMGIDATKPDSEMTQAQLAELKSQREAQSGGIFNSPIFKPIEWVGSKLYQVYSSTVSPALSAGAMAAHSIVYGRPDYIGEDGEWDAIKDYWNYAHDVSPGQSIWMLGLNDKELKDRGIRPDQISEDLNLQEKGKYRDKATVDDPFGIKTRSQEYFGSGASKWVSGTTDFAVSWYADPLVLAGKGLGKIKSVGWTQPIAKGIAKEEKAVTRGGTLLSDAEINKLAYDNFTQKSNVQSLVDHIWNIKTANPDTAATVLARDLPTLRPGKTANGAPTARLLAQATDKNDVTNILRITMGDKAALSTLEFKNSMLAYQADALGQKTSAASTYYDSLSPAVQASPRGQRIKAAIDAQSQWISKLDQDSQIVTDKIKAFNMLGDLNYNRITTPAGMKVRGALQNRTWQPTAGNNFVSARVNNIYNLSIGGVLRMAHSYNDIRPSHYIDTNDAQSWRQVEASLREAPGLSREARDMYTARYLEADEQGRNLALQNIETSVTHNIVDRYNLKNGLTGTPDELSYGIADSLYKELATRRGQGQAAMKQQTFGSATIENPNLPGTQLRVAEIEGDGGKTVLSPVLMSQLANSHVMMDFKLFEDAIKTHGSSWQKAMNTVGTGWEKAVDLADAAGSMWKFAQLFRLGYGPRALADDALGQIARFGFFDMMDRTVKGGRYAAKDLVNGTFLRGRTEAAAATAATLDTHIADLTNLQKSIKSELAVAESQKDVVKISQLKQDHELSMQWMDDARTTRADMDKLLKGGQAMQHVKVGRQIFDPAHGGKEGQLFADLSSGDKNFRNLMGSQADFYLDRMRRMDWENIVPAQHGAEKHMDAWLRVINQQVANDALAVQHLSGKTPNQLLTWLRTTVEGRAYAAEAPLRNLPKDEMIKRVTAQVDEWLNPAFPNSGAFRDAARTGTVTKDMLESVPEAARPLINSQALSYAKGNHAAAELLDRGITGFYNVMNQIPARKLLRHPLFAQRYKFHLAADYKKMRLQGETHIEEGLRQGLESSARQKALDDVKKNTFTMDHETKMAYAMRHFGAFFGAQQESWNRWGRIISDKPDILPRVAQVYGAPARGGMVVDQNGNQVDGAGYVTDPITGEKRLVDYSDRNILVQIPDFLGGRAIDKFLGLSSDQYVQDPDTGKWKKVKSDAATLRIPMSTAEIILNHGDGALPIGAGPLVSIPANNIPGLDIDANGDPKLADIYQKLGILPMGPQQSNWDLLIPNTAKRAEATDSMSDTYQKNLFYIMQAETYKYDMHMRKKPPTWKEISDRASRWSAMRTFFAFGLPFSVNAQDPYQFFRDQYKQMQDADYKNADQNFYDKYGDSAYLFSQSMSKNNTGLKPTTEAVHASKYYRDLIDKVGPEWAGLVVGSEGDGVYSNGAYYYEKTHAADSASGLPERTQMTARQAYDESQKSLGWRQYKSYMNNLYSQLFSRGLQTFDDEGAEDLKAQKQSLVQTLSDPQIMDENGNMVDNPYYNKQWSAEFNSLDKNYYDRSAASLRQIVNDPELWSKAVSQDGTVGQRSDIYTLKTYLSYRDDVKRALILRNNAGGSDDINAESNADIKQQWNSLVIKLVESDTKFGDLHSRYLSRDLGFDQDTVQTAQDTGQLPEFAGDETSNEGQSIFDVLAQQGGF